MPPDEKCLDRVRNPRTKKPVCSQKPPRPDCPYARKVDYEVRCCLPDPIGEDCIKDLSSRCKHCLRGAVFCEYYKQNECMLPAVLKKLQRK